MIDTQIGQLIGPLKRDRLRYATIGGWHRSRGFWLIAVYRFGRWAQGLPPALRLPMWCAYRVAQLSYLFFNINLPAGAHGARIGAGLCLIHPNNVYIGHGVVIGENCLIHHEVTLGMGSAEGAPVIGDNVTIFPGARIVGGVTIGDGAVIGANCVVQRDVPAGAVLMVPTPRRIPRTLSKWARDRAELPPAPAEFDAHEARVDKAVDTTIGTATTAASPARVARTRPGSRVRKRAVPETCDF